jgi:hypothetical protein
MKAANLIGQTFGHLTVLAAIPREHRRTWNCLCVCGAEHEVTTGNLRNGSIRSCGCCKEAASAAAMTKHGHNRGSHRTKEYRAWAHLVGRCRNPTDAAWADYGGRGIAVCDRWAESFETFLADVGRAPSPRHSIDRIEVNGDYEPDNCRWATPAEQARNTRRAIRIEGRPLKDICEERGLPFKTIYARVRRGSTPEEALRG